MQSLEDLSLEGQDILNVLDGACNRRTAQSIRRHMADLQVRQCEQNLKALQQGLQDLDNDLLETDNCIRRLRYLAQQQVPMPPVGSTGEDVTSVAAHVHSGLPLYDSSDSSVESGASESSYEGL
jgi:hypothetical protein